MIMNKLISAVCIAVVIAVQTVFCTIAHAVSPDIIGELFELNMKERGAEGFYDDLLLGDADWTVFCRARLYGAENSAEFLRSAKQSARELVNTEGFVTPTELQRTAVVLSAYGECPNELINAAAYCNPNLDKQGVNAWIWAVIAANCSGLPAEDGALHTRTELAEGLISKQLADGGFALRGDKADVDITAAAIYALAPLSGNENVKKSLDNAVSALSRLQLDNGGFLSLGNEVCESTAQAVIAFTAAGVDDERLDGALSALMSYKCADGGFSHTPGGKSNITAASQALQAFAAAELAGRGERLFDLPKTPDNSQNEPVSDSSSEVGGESADSSEIRDSADVPENSDNGGFKGFHIKLMISAALCVSGAAVLIVGIARRGKTGIVIGAVLIILSGGVWLLDIRTPDEYYSQTVENGITVLVGAECTSVLSRLDSIDESVNPRSAIPEDGIILALGEVTVSEGATAFDALVEAARANKIPVDRVGSAYGVYVRGIGNVYEFGFGGESGWTYRVNGISPQISAGAYKLSEGDTVEFVYVCELG